MDPTYAQAWFVVAELDPLRGHSPDGESELPLAASATRQAAMRELDRLQRSGDWDDGWIFDVAPAPLRGEMGEQVHLVFAEFDGCGGTPNGQYFVPLRAFADPLDADRFADDCRATGDWGSFASGEPRSSSGWYIGAEALPVR